MLEQKYSDKFIKRHSIIAVMSFLDAEQVEFLHLQITKNPTSFLDFLIDELLFNYNEILGYKKQILQKSLLRLADHFDFLDITDFQAYFRDKIHFECYRQINTDESK